MKRGGGEISFLLLSHFIGERKIVDDKQTGTVDFNHKKFKLIDSKVKQAELGARENFRDNATMSRSRKIVALSLIFRKLSRCR